MPGDLTAVALTRVDDLTDAAVDQAVEQVLDLLADPLRDVGKGDRVVIKPNMFQRKPGFRTSPGLLLAVAKRASARGAEVFVAERTHVLKEILDGSPLHRYAQVVSFDDRPLRIVQIPGATSLRVPVAIPDIVTECDFFIGAPQLRTHSSVVLTNAMKNLVGLLPGFTTRIVHMAGVEESLVDLNLLRPQHLLVCDATTVIEGNYPMEGSSREVGLVSASRNAVAMDATMAAVAGVQAWELAYLRDAHRRGLGPVDLADIEVRGVTVEEAGFVIDRAPVTLVPPREGIHVHAGDGLRRLPPLAGRRDEPAARRTAGIPRRDDDRVGAHGAPARTARRGRPGGQRPVRAPGGRRLSGGLPATGDPDGRAAVRDGARGQRSRAHPVPRTGLHR